MEKRIPAVERQLHEGEQLGLYSPKNWELRRPRSMNQRRVGSAMIYILASIIIQTNFDFHMRKNSHKNVQKEKTENSLKILPVMRTNLRYHKQNWDVMRKNEISYEGCRDSSEGER